MMDTVTLYMALKTAHIIAFVSWMAGMFYLPRLFVYHSRVAHGSEASELFTVMERKLLRIIMNPAMILTWIFGIWLAVTLDAFAYGWLHAKMTLVLLMSGVHGWMAVHRKRFEAGTNTKSERYFRYLNEVPTVLLFIIVALAVFKPF